LGKKGNPEAVKLYGNKVNIAVPDYFCKLDEQQQQLGVLSCIIFKKIGTDVETMEE